MTTSTDDYLARVPTMSASEHPSSEDIIAKEGLNFTLQGKTVLVTGASSGIGVHTVASLASKGARVLVAVRDVEKTKKVLTASLLLCSQFGRFWTLLLLLTQTMVALRSYKWNWRALPAWKQLQIKYSVLSRNWTYWFSMQVCLIVAQMCIALVL